ncbi:MULTISPECIES: hypothetical protein [unclassified Kribbella]|uniref:hypothetical protein n=1 Tax=unclassified Kribbella TaxID=2644121 RepID=UPI003016A10B
MEPDDAEPSPLLLESSELELLLELSELLVELPESELLELAVVPVLLPESD